MRQWHEKQVRQRETIVKVEITGLAPDGRKVPYRIFFPSEKYPIPSNKPEIFKISNTEPVHDSKTLEIFDRIDAKIGQCFVNTYALVSSLNRNGIDAVPYAGWLFLDDDLPVFHAWTVINGNRVLDYSEYGDSVDRMLSKLEDETMSLEEKKDAFAKITAKMWQLDASERCCPVGKVSRKALYIGSPCDPFLAQSIQRHLLEKYPQHEAFSPTNENERTEAQERVYKLQHNETRAAERSSCLA